MFPKPRAPAPGHRGSTCAFCCGPDRREQLCPADGGGATLESHTHRDRLLRGLLHAGPQLTLGLLTLTLRGILVSLSPFPHGSPDAQTGWMTSPSFPEVSELGEAGTEILGLDFQNAPPHSGFS